MDSSEQKKHNSYRYEALFNQASMGIIVVDSRAAIQSANPFALRLFGYVLEEVLNKPIEMLIPGRYHSRHVGHRDVYSHNPKTRPMGVGMDLFAIKKDGSEFPVEVSLSNYEDQEDQFVIAFISDISIRKKAEAEIEELNNKLEYTVEQRTKELRVAMQDLEQSKDELSKLLEREKELGELKSRFVTIASHEFRTPLSTILSSTYLIERYTTTEEQHRREKHLQRIVSSVQLLTDILNDFLSVGKIEEGKIQVRFTNFDIEQLVADITREMEVTLKKGQRLVYRHRGNREVALDASLLKHIVINLVSNASKFSPENGPIEVETLCRAGVVRLSVKDNGIGISREDQKHLMERFFRAANAGNIQGTGLGLHIISKYTELMDGHIECVSELEQGTEFIITFGSAGAQQPEVRGPKG
ncbi:PAS domain-containing sensor histidine kinase [Niabella drilacis]|uniref:histidine kinase n=1 Tax=Niabella drilacis (strain DSM 25811 / CCM 8410 / CCUG 62505 / LMG 26954 / E90) TaxID=1285928 RepID=A0A1G6UV43_NIADE|nr:PAS domain-containing sensor histidine kinase [Niabella drilacis]SDD45208.1 PAS domain S-box-containing protein [Niabella drilacis]